MCQIEPKLLIMSQVTYVPIIGPNAHSQIIYTHFTVQNRTWNGLCNFILRSPAIRSLRNQIGDLGSWQSQFNWFVRTNYFGYESYNIRKKTTSFFKRNYKFVTKCSNCRALSNKIVTNRPSSKQIATNRPYILVHPGIASFLWHIV